MKIIGMSLTHNDHSKGWLQDWLDTNNKYLDEWVIVDDCSTDTTLDVIEEYKARIAPNIHLTKTDEPTFKTHENKLRAQLWNEVKKVATDGDVVIVIDSDEILTVDFKDFKTMVGNVSVKNPQFIFKKIEMWNDTEYRIDGLWSNYFTRGFLFRDKEWGYDAKGFHFPQVPKYVFEGNEVVNTDLRVLHLAYKTEELRKSKVDFMMTNPQQTKDITYYHLQTTCDKNPKLKEFTPEIVWPEVNLVVVCNNLFKLEKGLLNTLQNHAYKGKINVYFYVCKCNLDVMKQISELDLDVSKFEVNVKNYEEEYDNIVKHKNAVLKSEVFKTKEFDKDSYVVFIDGHKSITKSLLKHIIVTDKDVVIERMFGNILALKGDVFKQSQSQKYYLYRNNNVFNNQLISILKKEGNNIWGIMGGAPFPI